VSQDTCIVHEEVESPELILHTLSGGVNVGAVNYVTGDADRFDAVGFGDLFRSAITIFLFYIEDYLVCTPGRQIFSNGTTDAAGRTRDRGRLALKRFFRPVAR